MYNRLIYILGLWRCICWNLGKWSKCSRSSSC